MFSLIASHEGGTISAEVTKDGKVTNKTPNGHYRETVVSSDKATRHHLRFHAMKDPQTGIQWCPEMDICSMLLDGTMTMLEIAEIMLLRHGFFDFIHQQMPYDKDGLDPEENWDILHPKKPEQPTILEEKIAFNAARKAEMLDSVAQLKKMFAEDESKNMMKPKMFKEISPLLDEKAKPLDLQSVDLTGFDQLSRFNKLIKDKATLDLLERKLHENKTPVFKDT